MMRHPARNRLRKFLQYAAAILVFVPLGLLCLMAFLFSFGKFLYLEGDTYDRYQGGGNFAGSDPEMSPDGRSIAYASPRSGRGDLYLVSRDGKHTRRLSNDPRYEGEPSFSPDGKRIVYVKQVHHFLRSYHSHVWIMNRDGTEKRQITHGDKEYFYPKVLPDGKHILCDRTTRDRLKLQTCLLRIAGDGEPVTLAKDNVSDAVLSPAGDRIFYTDRDINREPENRVAVMNRDGSNRRILGSGHSPSVSPDGKQLVFVDEPYGQSLWIMNAAGSNRRLLLNTRSQKIQPAFTPDGKHILFLDSTGSDVGQITLIGRDGSGLERIASVK